MNVVQKWLTIVGGLGALFLVVSNPTGVAQAFGAAQKFISGTESTAITGKA